MSRRAQAEIGIDRELRDMPEELRRREFMMRIEAVIFAASEPVKREVLASITGDDCKLDELLALIGQELKARPYEIVRVAGGYQYRTRPGCAAVIRGSGAVGTSRINLSPLEQLALTVIAYFQPITRLQIGDMLGKAVSRDVIGSLRSAGVVATGPRSPQPGAPYTYVTTEGFLQLSGLDSLRDLPDIDRLEEAGLLGKAPMPDELRAALGLTDPEGGQDEKENLNEEEAIGV
jgi:segregation and condensation protein B